MEAVRWNMAHDIPWGDFDRSKLSDEQAHTIKMNAITEWAALPATEMFLRDNRGDSDFCAFMSVWFFEEQKHSLVLIEYLRRFRPDPVSYTHLDVYKRQIQSVSACTATSLPSTERTLPSWTMRTTCATAWSTSSIMAPARVRGVSEPSSW